MQSHGRVLNPRFCLSKNPSTRQLRALRSPSDRPLPRVFYPLRLPRTSRAPGHPAVEERPSGNTLTCNLEDEHDCTCGINPELVDLWSVIHRCSRCSIILFGVSSPKTKPRFSLTTSLVLSHPGEGFCCRGSLSSFSGVRPVVRALQKSTSPPNCLQMTTCPKAPGQLHKPWVMISVDTPIQREDYPERLCKERDAAPNTPFVLKLLRKLSVILTLNYTVQSGVGHCRQFNRLPLTPASKCLLGGAGGASR